MSSFLTAHQCIIGYLVFSAKNRTETEPSLLGSIPTQKFKLSSQLVDSEDRVETNGWTDMWMDEGDCITSHANAVGNNSCEIHSYCLESFLVQE